jgi:hypothetical protein
METAARAAESWLKMRIPCAPSAFQRIRLRKHLSLFLQGAKRNFHPRAPDANSRAMNGF